MLHRSRQDIISDIIVRANEPILKIHLMYSAHLTHDQLKAYLRKMMVAGLLEHTPDNRWVCTDKGRKYVRIYKQLEKLTEQQFQSLSH
jgi:predicted transcriptional regulator